jgi:molybdate transport system substrate-binding protein
MDALKSEGLLVAGTRRDVVGNSLVLITPVGAVRVKDFTDLASPEVKTIALGEPATVPAGMYARQTLGNLGLFRTVEKKIVYAKDVRAVLTYVETGNADAGIVYRSDAKASTKARVAALAPAASHDPIVYPAAVLKDSKHIAGARAFLEFCGSPEADAVFRKYGFTTPEKPTEKY